MVSESSNFAKGVRSDIGLKRSMGLFGLNSGILRSDFQTPGFCSVLMEPFISSVMFAMPVGHA